MPSGTLEKKVAIVTGAGRGIDRAIVERFAAEGAAVVVSQRSAAEGRALYERLAGESAAVEFVPAVVRDEAVASLVDATLTGFGRVDVLCNNAGVGLLLCRGHLGG